MALVALGKILPPDVLNIIQMDVINMRLNEKQVAFKEIHQQLKSIFIHANSWNSDYEYSNKELTLVFTMLRSRYAKVGRITDLCRRGQCRCFPRRRNNYATMIYS